MPDQFVGFFVPGIPKGQGNHRKNRYGRTYETTKGHGPWRQSVAWSAKMAMGKRPPWDRACIVSAWFYFPRPAGHLTKLGKLRAGKPRHATSHKLGDVDKLLRCICDAMSGIVYGDDRYVIGFDEVRKCWIEPAADPLDRNPRDPGVRIQVEVLPS